MPAGSRGIKAGRAYVELGVSDKLTVGLKKAQAKLRAFGASVQSVGQKLLGVGVAAATGFALPVAIFTRFEDSMLKVKAVTGATADEFVMLTEKAKELGRTTSFTAKAVADAQVELGRAGFKPAQIDAAIGDVLDLARATDTELPRAAEFAAAAMRGFGLAASDSTRIANALARTANGSAQTLEDLGEAVKFVAPLASEAGESLEDTAAAIGLLANNGIKGTMAGTSLARAYKELSKSAKQSALKRIGVDALDANKNLRPVVDIIQDVGKAVANKGSGERLAIFEEIFGRGQAAALKLGQVGTAFRDLKANIGDAAPTAKATAKEMDSGLGGSFRRLLSAVEGIALAIGDSLAPMLDKIATKFTEWSGKITALVSKYKPLIVIAAKVTLGIIATGAAMIAAAIGIKLVAFSLGAVATVIGVVVVGFKLLAAGIVLVLSPIGLIVAGIVTLGVVLAKTTGYGAKLLGWLSEKFEALKGRALSAFGGIRDAMAAGEMKLAAKILWQAIKNEFARGVSALKMIWVQFKSFFIDLGYKLWFGFQAAAEFAFHAVNVAWIKTVAAMKTMWVSLSTNVKSIWREVVGVAEKGINQVVGKAKALAGGKDDSAERNKYAEQNKNADLRKYKNAADKAIAEIDSDRAKALKTEDGIHAKILTNIAKEYEAEKAALEQSIKDTDAAEKEKLAGLNAELAALKVVAALKAAEAKKKNQNENPAPEVDKIVDEMKKGANVAAATITKSKETRGTFNSRAFQSLATAGETLQKRILDAQERGVAAIKGVDASIKNVGGYFA